MERKKIEKILVLKCTLQSSLKTLINDIGNLPNQLMDKVTELGLEVLGPQVWQYEGSDGNPDTSFLLSICIPVKEQKGDPGNLRFDFLKPIDCISEIHKGPWMKLGDTYQKMLGEMSRKGMVSTCNSREIYMVCDYENQENCLTEVQIEIQ
jgi:effector-binding domain-containing protein